MAEEDKKDEQSEMLDQSEKLKFYEPKDSPSRCHYCSTFFTKHKTLFGHVAKTILLGMAINLLDVSTDVGSGLSHQQPKNVTRTFMENDTVPDNCIVLPEELQRFDCLDCTILPNTTDTGHNYKCLDCTSTTVLPTHVCLEEDTVWAAITFGCIQMPAIVLALCAAVGTVFVRCSYPPSFYAGHKKALLGSLLLLIIPFPLLVFVQQVASLFIQTDQMELLSAVFLFGEGALEASPQLLLLLYIIGSDAEREIPWIQKASIVSSLLTISKTSIEMFVTESFGPDTSPSFVLDHSKTFNDSILKGKSLGRKLFIMVQLSPAFILSLAFKVGSIAIICALLKEYAVIYLALGIVITFIVECCVQQVCHR